MLYSQVRNTVDAQVYVHGRLRAGMSRVWAGNRQHGYCWFTPVSAPLTDAPDYPPSAATAYLHVNASPVPPFGALRFELDVAAESDVWLQHERDGVQADLVFHKI